LLLASSKKPYKLSILSGHQSKFDGERVSHSEEPFGGKYDCAPTDAANRKSIKTMIVLITLQIKG
jgi:hypothetical protein